MTECVKSSKIVVPIKIEIRTIKIIEQKKQVHDQKWDIQARTIVHEIGYYQTFTHEQSSIGGCYRILMLN